jgi:hypothetical protein
MLPAAGPPDARTGHIPNLDDRSERRWLVDLLTDSANITADAQIVDDRRLERALVRPDGRDLAAPFGQHASVAHVVADVNQDFANGTRSRGRRRHTNQARLPAQNVDFPTAYQDRAPGPGTTIRIFSEGPVDIQPLRVTYDTAGEWLPPDTRRQQPEHCPTAATRGDGQFPTARIVVAITNAQAEPWQIRQHIRPREWTLRRILRKEVRAPLVRSEQAIEQDTRSPGAELVADVLVESRMCEHLSRECRRLHQGRA